MIARLDAQSARRISAGQVITDLSSVVKELLENALDAGARAVTIRIVGYGLELVSVDDDGCGMPVAGLLDAATGTLRPGAETPLLSARATSKAGNGSGATMATTATTNSGDASLGFRGEALHALAQLADVEVTTMDAASAPHAVTLRHAAGAGSTELCVAPPGARDRPGTTVHARGLFRRMPVRERDYHNNRRRHLTRLTALLKQYAVSHPSVRLVATHQERSDAAAQTLVSLTGSGDLARSATEAYGGLCVGRMMPVCWPCALGEVRGLASRVGPGCGRLAPDQQVFTLDGRLVDLPRLARAIQEAYALNLPNASQKLHVAFFLNIDTTTAHRGEDESEGALGAADASDDGGDTDARTSGGLGLGRLSSSGNLPSSSNSGGLAGDAVSDGTPTHLRRKDDAGGGGGGQVYDVNLTPNKRKVLLVREAALAAELHEHALRSFQVSSEAVEIDRQARAARVESEARVADQITKMTRTSVAATSFTQFVFKRRRDEMEEAEEGEADAKEQSGGDEGERAAAAAAQQQRQQQQSLPTIGRLALQTALSMPLESQDGRAGFDLFASQRRHHSAAAAAPAAAVKRKTEEPQPPAPMIGAELYSDFSEGAGAWKEEGATVNVDSSPSSSSSSSSENVSEKSFSGSDSDSERGTPSRRPPAGVSSSPEGDDADASEAHHSGDNTGADNCASSESETAQRQLLPLQAPLRRAETADADTFIQTGPTFEEEEEEEEVTWLTDEGNERRDEGPSCCCCEHLLGGCGDGTPSLANHPMFAAPFPAAFGASPEGDDTDDDDGNGGGRGGKSRKRPRRAAKQLGEQTEEDLRTFFTKGSFRDMRIVGQFNQGFIMALLGGDLFVIDQHASDEIYNYERLLRAYKAKPQPLVVPAALRLEANEVDLALEHREALLQHGFLVCRGGEQQQQQQEQQQEATAAASATTLLVRAVPVLPYDHVGAEDVVELVQQLARYGTLVRPLRAVWHSTATKACRGSIMIGTALAPRTMRAVVDRLAGLERPWNCPHGRPTMRHLCHISHVHARLPSAVATAHRLRKGTGDGSDGADEEGPHRGPPWRDGL